MYFVYLLKCADGSIYTGITTNLKRRLQQHKSQKGGAYTRAHTAVKIVHTEQFPNRSDASRREFEVKRWSRTKKLDLIKGRAKLAFVENPKVVARAARRKTKSYRSHS